ncbi:MAG: galactose mutarotase [Bacteroidales bacterium]|nr:galactose mutarotase [Bacteroidales bacterium]
MKNFSKLFGLAVIALPIVSSCSSPKEPVLTKSGLDPQKFVATINGKQTGLYTLTNANGMEVCFTNVGGRIVSIMVPDRNGELKDVVLGFDNVLQYANMDANGNVGMGDTPSDFGASIGRYANRIAQGKFTLDGTEYDLPKNNFGHCLHGGPTGWQYQVYDATYSEDSTSITMSIVSPDGDNGFPGTVKASCTYTLTDENELVLTYSATTDKPTIINMTNHSYFNLSGDPNNKITEDSLIIFSNQITPVDSTYMTTGEIRTIDASSPFYFLPEKGNPHMYLVGAQIDANDEQIKNGNGYDHNWVLLPTPEGTEKLDLPACILMSPKSGIVLIVKTTEPGVQCYSGNFLDGTAIGKKGIAYQQRTGICLETQKYPDTPNKPEWPSCVLRPGEEYSSVTIFKFSTDNAKK